jgi:diacylglycerol kinase family enzyme
MNKQKLKRIFDGFNYLLSRWADEQEYESFSHYIKYAKELVEKEGFVFIILANKPMNLMFSDSDKIYKVKYEEKKLICKSVMRGELK